MSEKVNVIGAGLAGREATWQLIRKGIGVRLYEMRPVKEPERIRLLIFLNWYVQTV